LSTDGNQRGARRHLSSPSKVQPVFDAIVKSSLAIVQWTLQCALVDGELIHRVAAHNFSPEALEAIGLVFPARPTRAIAVGRAIVTSAVVHNPDVEIDPEHQILAVPRAVGWRSALLVPMLREGAPVGVIGIARADYSLMPHSSWPGMVMLRSPDRRRPARCVPPRSHAKLARASPASRDVALRVPRAHRRSH